jgi:hypothetical protein
VPVTAKTRRRWFGGVCLLTSIALLVVGDTTPGKRLDGMVFVLYWLACFAFAALAMLIAILDARALRRDARAEQRALFETAFHDIRKKKIRKEKDA